MLASRRYLGVVVVCAAGTLLGGCCPKIVILPATLPDGVEGTAYRRTLSANGRGSMTWRVSSSSLPAGLTLGSTTGVISGTPTENGAFAFSIIVSDDSLTPCQGEIDYSLLIIEQLAIDANVPTARRNDAYSHAFAPSGGTGPYTAVLIGLPAGLGFDPNTATISGTPAVSRTDPYPIELTVTDSGTPQQTLVEDFDLTVKAPAVSITTTSLADGQRGVSYSAQLEADDGAMPLTWKIAAGVLPDGLRITDQTNGVISGTPTKAGMFTFTVEVEDSDTSAPTTDSKELSITVE